MVVLLLGLWLLLGCDKNVILGIRDEAIEMVNLAPAEMEDNEEAKGAKEYEKEESSFKVEVNHSHSTENEGMVKILIPL